MRIKGLVFDKDGTLTDFHATWPDAYKAAADALAAASRIPVSALDLLKAGGYDVASGRCIATSLLASGSNGEIAQLWCRLTGAEFSEVLTTVEIIFSQYAARSPVPATDLHAVLGALREARITLGVATMDSESLAHQTLQELTIGGYFDFVCGYDSGFGVKPGPGMIEAFCDHTGLAVGEVGIVGDSLHDLNMGSAAGVAVRVGVLTGAADRSVLEPSADYVLEDISGLIELLT